MTFDGSYNISPAHQPRRPHAGLHRAQRQRVPRHDAGPRRRRRRRRSTDTSDDESPSFAPNGRLIIYATRAQGRDVLMTTTLDGKIKTRLLSSAADVREPVWGPFGR